ncbi:MAG: DUF3089 domain-containing protein [Lentisphaeria bacterium]|nr:DUF3089 domain-containing protein [Lentisphaeria bacterium]
MIFVPIVFRLMRLLPAVLLCPALFVLASCSAFRAEGPETPAGAEPESASETSSAEPAKSVVEISAPLVIPPPPDYANPASWVRTGGPDPAPPEFEVFYIYPTLFQNKLRPVMDHRFERIRTKADNYIGLTFGLLTDPAHPLKLYAPFVRQADYSTALETDFAADLNGTLLQYGIEDTKTAFEYYMKFFHTPGVPFILVGHSQGASDLYELLRASPEITPESGFAAAYLAGLPKKTAKEIERDFAGRGIRLGKGADDTGVILTWNTVAEDAGDNIFTVPGGAVINPVNWKTDDTPADLSDSQDTAYYYVSEKEPAGTFKASLLDGAHADPARGAMVVGLPGDSQYDASAQMGEGIFHSNDIFFFAGFLRENMVRRAAAWRAKHPAPPAE